MELNERKKQRAVNGVRVNCSIGVQASLDQERIWVKSVIANYGLSQLVWLRTTTHVQIDMLEVL